MPPRWKLTKQEKNELKRQYRQNVNYINQHLDPGNRNRVPLNMAAFERRLNDPKEVKLYKSGLEYNRKAAAQEATYERIKNTYDQPFKLPGKTYALDRVIHCLMIPEISEEAEAYNREVVKQYREHPEAMAQTLLKKVFQVNPKYFDDYHRTQDFDGLMLDRYKRDEVIETTAFNIHHVLTDLKTAGLLNETVLQNKDAIEGNYEALGYSLTQIGAIKDDAYFTIPYIDVDSFMEVTTNAGGDNTFCRRLQASQTAVENQGPNRRGASAVVDLQGPNERLNVPGAMGRFIGEYTDEVTGEINKASPISRAIAGEEGGNFNTTVLPVSEIRKMDNVLNKDFTNEKGFKMPEKPAMYRNVAETARSLIIEELAIRTQGNASKIDSDGLYSVADSYAGNFKERFFHTTSRQYKNFKSVLNKFENPRSRGYKDTNALKTAANEYLIHKGVHNLQEAMALPQPGKDRALLCLTTLEKVQEAEGPQSTYLRPGLREPVQVDLKKKGGYPPAIENAKDVSIDDNENEIDTSSKKKDKEVVIDNNIIQKDDDGIANE